MFSSNRRRASIVSDAGEEDGDESTWAGTGAHPTVSRVTSQADEIFVRAIHLCGKWSRNLNRSRQHWRLRFPLLADDVLEDLDTAREIISIHYERRENTQRVLPGGECEQTTFPAAFHDVVR
jgi:hypothetical protein